MSTLAVAFTLVSSNLALPQGLLEALCMIESNHEVLAMSNHDGGSKSYGVCQIKMNTAKLVGFKGTEKQLMEPTINIYYSGKYLQKQINRYKDLDKAVSAYNAGSYRTFNRLYVNKVMKQWRSNHVYR
jgi:soluble lytic murein transglycosylase-like protein